MNARGAGEGLGRSQRLLRSSLFEEAYAQNAKSIGRFLVLFLRRGEGACLRLGVVTGRKVGPAVTRVRARRRLREVYRRHRGLLRNGADVVLVARKGIDTAAWDDLVRDFLRAAQRVGLLKAEEAPPE